MARYKGIFKATGNYEPHVAAPFDARSLVEAKADLTDAKTWQHSNGDIWVYAGMIVAVAADSNPANNGVYMLTGSNYTLEESWIKMADSKSIEDLQNQIDNIEVSGGGSLDKEVEIEAELPETGDENTTYYIKENQSIQRWDAEIGSYVSYGGATEIDINIIYGGDANGNTTD